MALLDSEIAKIKAELGYNLLDNGAEPYISVVAIFSQVVQQYVSGGTSTTSSTDVPAASTPTAVTLTLASGTGFAAHARVSVDVGPRQESAIVQSVSGADVTLLLQNAHSGIYPVAVEGAESIIRDTLRRIDAVKLSLEENYGAGALKAVDEIEFYQAGEGETYFGSLGRNLTFWRNELAAQIGVPNNWGRKRAAGATLSVY